MKNVRYALQGILLTLLFVSASASASPALEDDANDVRSDARVISARAGRVNFVSGDVRLRRADSLETRLLTAEDELKSGDSVITGAGGRVEILLNPGSYFRAGAGTEFTLAEADLDDLRVELARGSAVVEATGYRESELLITVATPRTAVRIIRTGIYRINALPDGAAEVAVFEGRAMVGETMVKGGKLARASASGVEVSKFDKKKNRDELDLWSRDRGKELAKANEKLQHRAVRAFFARNSFDSIFDPYGGLRGLWFYNDRMRCYTFLPFGGYWRSPYGYWYGTGIVPYYPSRRWPGGQSPVYTPPGTNGGGTASGGTPMPPPGITPGGGNPGRGGFTPPTPSLGDRPDRAPSMPRMDRGSPAEGSRPRRDNP